MRTRLTIWDIFSLAIIFFGVAIYSSTVDFFALREARQSVPETLGFDDSTNWLGMVSEGVSLCVAYAYLRWRQFDFGQLNFSFNRYTLPKTLLYFVLAGSVATVFEGVLFSWFPHWYPSDEQAVYSAADHFAMWSPLFVAFSLLNGVYEEFFFIALVALTEKKYLPWAIVLSLVVRFAFHTYQGLAAALTITTLGIVFLVLRYKSDALLPFMWSHSLFDLFGLGLPMYLLADVE